MNPERLNRKEFILYIAGELFMEKGFQATSTREIAEKSQIKQPNLYHHFKTKEDIYVAVLERLSLQVKDGLETIINQPHRDLEECLIEILTYLRNKHPANFTMMSHDMTFEISNEHHAQLYVLWRSAYLDPLETLFSRYLPQPHRFTPAELARHFYSVIAPFIQKDNRFNQEVSADNIIHLFVHGIL